ncbi:GGDEF domain-containing protein [Hoeflea sp. TYP-13]|uniref:GGDEF domain-containing protein n=1 Tax=Hoeflea sp. TYP-13 TaxID=3230023 RepID=UPI0034C5C845
MGISYIHAVNIGLAAAVICGLAAIYLYDRSRKSALWWMLSFTAVLLMGVASIAVPLFAPEPITRFVVFALNIMAISCLNVGIASYLDSRIPWRIIDGMLAGTLVLNFVAGMFFPAGIVTSSIAALSLACVQGIGLYLLMKSQIGRKDRVFVGFLGLAILNYLSRPPLQALAAESAADGTLSGVAIAMHINNTMIVIGLATFLMLRLANQLVMQLKGQSETDSLSGLFNRHGFQAAVHQTRNNVQSTAPASLIICDLDRFKSINDDHGHFVGDRVIAAFGRLVRAGAREGDICGRVGGEEFCVYLRNSDARAARLFAEWLRVAFASTSYPELDANVRFTASFGVTQVAQDEAIEEAYVRADRALYTAKREGRNCVRLIGEAGDSEQLSGISFSKRSGR